MPLWPGRKALTALFAAPFACIAWAAAQTAAAETTVTGTAASDAFNEASIKLDQQIQALKDEVIEFNREAQRAEDEVLFPPNTRLSVYLGVKVSGLLLTEASVSIDDGAPEKYSYSDRDSKALVSERNLQRLLRTNVKPGAHRIRVSISGQFADADKDDPPVTDSYEAIFDKGQGTTELEFLLARDTRVSKPRLRLTQWRPAKS